jgi:LPS O-antigen subunit length determinant protein (WzzB/FepE family)
MIAVLKYWKDGVWIIMGLFCISLILTIKVKNNEIARNSIVIADQDSQIKQLKSALEETREAEAKAADEQFKRDKLAERRYLERSKGTEAINAEVLSEDCTKLKDWAILKAFEFRQDR